MKKRMLVAVVALFAVTVISGDGLLAQTAQERPGAKEQARIALPTRSEKHRSLEVLAGDWMITGRTYEGSLYGAGKFTAREHNEFMKGGMFLVSRTQYSGLFKDSNQIGFFGVDPKTNEYTYAMYNSLGVIVQVTGQLRNKERTALVNNAITWTNDVAFGPGKDVNVDVTGGRMVYTIEVVSRNEYRFNLERGGVRTMEGVARRVNAVGRGR